MPRIIWRPLGSLDVSTAATDLPQEVSQNTIASGAFQRCKNFELNREGRAEVRRGSSRFNEIALEDPAVLIIEMGGVRYSFTDTHIYKDEIAVLADMTAGNWSGVIYNAFNATTDQIFALNGTERKRVTSTAVNEWGIDPSVTAATLGVGASTGLTGDYLVRYTYARKSGSTVIYESNPSPASASQTLSNESLDISWDASTDTQTTHVRIYRTLAGGSVYYHDQDVAVGATTVDSTTADSALGAQLATNHDRPPTGTVVAGPFYNGYVFIAKDNLLYWCLAKQPEYWPTTQFIEVGVPHFPIKSIVELSGRVYCLTKDQIWLIQGTGDGSFLPIPMRSMAGSPVQFGAVSVEGRGIYHMGPDGIYLFSGSRDVKITQGPFDSLFTTQSIQNGVNAVVNKSAVLMLQYQNYLYFHWSGGHILKVNLDTGKTVYHKYDTGFTALAVDSANDRILAGDDLGYVRHLENLEQTTDPGGAIAWEIESKDFTLQTRSNFLRWVKWDADVSNATSPTGRVVYDGTVHQSHSLTVDRDTARRRVKAGNGARVSLRVDGSGPATFYAAEAE